MLQVSSMLKRNVAAALLTATCVAPNADAQQAPTPAAGGPAAAPAATPPAPVVVSPEVLPDARVVFRLYGPQATEVAVQGVIRGRVPMVKGENGVWEATVGPLTPGAYQYSFVVQGVQMPDPRNQERNETTTGIQQPPGRARLGDDGHQERPARCVGAGVL